MFYPTINMLFKKKIQVYFKRKLYFNLRKINVSDHKNPQRERRQGRNVNVGEGRLQLLFDT